MAIARTTASSNETVVDTIQRDMDTIYGELNKGIDVTQLPGGKITVDKLNASISGTGSTGYWISGAAIAAGGVGSIGIGVTTGSLGVGVGSGFYFPITTYCDIFVDPTGSGAFTIANIYSAGTPDPNGGSTKFISSVYNKASASTIVPQMFQSLIKIHNTDTVAHNYYVVINWQIINSQATASQ